MNMGALLQARVQIHRQGVRCCLHHLHLSRTLYVGQRLQKNKAKGSSMTALTLSDPSNRWHVDKQRPKVRTFGNAQYTMKQSRRSKQHTIFKCRSPLLALTPVTSETFVPHQTTLCGFHPRRSVSTEPTTAYEIVLASQPVQLAQTLLETIHDQTGLPWWASIILTTFLFRGVLTLPLGVYTQYIKAKVERLQPEIVLMTKRLFVQRFAERVKLEGWTEKRVEMTLTRLAKRYSKELFIRDNCHPAKGSVLLLVQLPLWVCLSLSLRNMTGAFGEAVYLDPANVVSSLSTEGALWIPDLTMTDPYYILPVLVGSLNLLNIEMMALQANQASRMQRYVTNFLRAISVCMIPISAYVPTAMTLYWATSAFYGLGQNVLLKSPSARSILRIPSAPSDSKTPFRDMGDVIKRRYLGRRDEGSAEEEKEDQKGKEKDVMSIKDGRRITSQRKREK